MGVPQAELAQEPSDDPDRRGTMVTFVVDKGKFASSARFEAKRVAGRLRELALLNPGARVRFRAVEKAGGEYSEWAEYLFEGGLRAMVDMMVEGKQTLHPTVHVRRTFEVSASRDSCRTHEKDRVDALSSLRGASRCICGFLLC